MASYNKIQLQYSIKTLAIKKLSNAVVRTKVINCNSANKSCLLQVVHTKVITVLTQFCDYYLLNSTFSYINSCQIMYLINKILDKEICYSFHLNFYAGMTFVL